MSWQLLAMGMHTIILILPTFMFEIFHNQKNLRPPLKEKNKHNMGIPEGEDREKETKYS